MADLKTDYKDQLLDTSVNTERKFNLVDSDGNVIASRVSLRDITQYSQAGDTFGAADINKITEKINEQNTNLKWFPDYTKKIYESGNVVNTTKTYTTTEDCFIIYNLTIDVNKSSSILVDDIRIGYLSGGSAMAISGSFMVKKGSVIKITTNDTDHIQSFIAYGLK